MINLNQISVLASLSPFLLLTDKLLKVQNLAIMDLDFVLSEQEFSQKPLFKWP